MIVEDNIPEIISDNKDDNLIDILLTCGYTKTGKDTLFRNISGLSDNKHKYALFRSSKDIKLDNNFLKFISEKTKRIGFADQIKRDVNYELLGTYNPFAFDAFKDSLKVTKKGVPWASEMKTLRQYYIDHGCNMRKIDPDHWVKEAEKCIGDNTLINITDFRFPNECEYFVKKSEKYRVTTVRIFRSSVDVPNINEPSEHSLDQFVTDYVVISGQDQETINDEFNKLVKQFPQYADYAECLKF